MSAHDSREKTGSVGAAIDPSKTTEEASASASRAVPPGYLASYGIQMRPASGASAQPPLSLPDGYLSYYGIGDEPSIQRRIGGSAAVEDPAAIKDAADRGTSGAGGSLPHLDPIQKAFGHHDVTGIQAHTDASAAAGARSMGAEAFASGQHVAFAAAPSLHTAAHEAAHVVQQRGGVQLKGGVGEVGDSHERQADAVADAVVAGASAERMLDQVASPSGGPTKSVQRLKSEFMGKEEKVKIETLDKLTCETLIKALKNGDKEKTIRTTNYTFEEGDLAELEKRFANAPEKKAKAAIGPKKLSPDEKRARSAPTEGRVIDDETTEKDTEDWKKIEDALDHALDEALAHNPVLFVFSLGTSNQPLQSYPKFAETAVNKGLPVAIINVDSSHFTPEQQSAGGGSLKMSCLKMHFPLGERQEENPTRMLSVIEKVENSMAKKLMARVVVACQKVMSTGGKAVVLNAVGPANYPAFEAFKEDQAPTFIAAHYDHGKATDPPSQVVKDPHKYPYRSTAGSATNKNDEPGLQKGLNDITWDHL
jgi:hypothetical protein